MLALAMLSLAGAPAAHALDAKLLLRCTGHSAAEGAPGSLADPFDIAIETGRGKGWFPGLAVSEAQHGRLLTDPTSYRVKWRGRWGGATMTEWVLVDRVDGAFVGHFTQVDGQAVRRHRWGGACAVVPRRF
jgi:hypothetical protein